MEKTKLIAILVDEVVLTVKDLAGTAAQIPVEYKQLPESVTPGNLIFLNDGFIQLQVEKVSKPEQGTNKKFHEEEEDI